MILQLINVTCLLRILLFLGDISMDTQTLLKIFWIVLAMAVVGILFWRIESFKQEKFDADDYAKDISLIITRMLSLEQEEIEINYVLPEEYGARLDGNNVIVSFKNDIGTYGFFGNSDFISFEKDGGVLIIRKDE